MNCGQSFDKRGRTAQVNIICGDCPNGQCEGGLGCVCNISYDSTCRVLVELAIPCEKQGLRVFEGFTVGFHPRSWELVYNGMTLPGFEKSNNEFSGIDALPGMTLLSACLETVSGAGHGYIRPEEPNSPFVNQASWERQPASTRGTSRTSGRTYGSI